jgi:acyl-coenzyme A thioesterase 13
MGDATPTIDNDASTLSMVQSRWSAQVTRSFIYSSLLTPVTITSARPGHVLACLTLTKEHLNSKGGLHGSVSATIIDAFGGLAITSTDGRDRTGASVDINVSYLGSAGEGDVVEIEGRAEKVGGSLGFTEVRLFKVVGEERTLIVSGRHTKFVRGTAPAK